MAFGSPGTSGEKLTSLLTSDSQSVNTGSPGSDGILVVCFETRGATDVSTVTYNGVGLTNGNVKAANATASIQTEIWFLIGPATGTNTLSYSWAGTVQANVSWAVWTGGASSKDGGATGTGNSAAPSVDATPTVDNCLIVGCILHERHVALTVGSGETSIFDTDQGAWVTSMSYDEQGTKATQAIDWSASAADEYAESVLIIAPTGGGPAAAQFMTPNRGYW